MKIPRWVMVAICTIIFLTVSGAGILGWRSRPGPAVSGVWTGYGWGNVKLEPKQAGYDGTYSSTYGQAVGRIQVQWSARTRRYEGDWSEGSYRFGHVSFWVENDLTIRGVYTADPNCEREPGDPAHQEFQWAKSGTHF